MLVGSCTVKGKYNHQLHIGGFTKILPELLDYLGETDLILYDASKDMQEMEFAHERCIESLGDERVLLSDDVIINDSFENTAEKYDGEWEIILDSGIFRKQHS